MKNNLELHKIISFNELVEHGIKNGANTVKGMPWSWKINGKNITHENDDCYVIETMDKGLKKMWRGEFLCAYEDGLVIMYNHGY